MKVKILKSTLQLPPLKICPPSSKSLSHRALICAALAHGRSFISNIAVNDDIEATAKALSKLGANIDFVGNYCIVDGIKKTPDTSFELDANESGSTLRFMIPLASLTGQKVTFTGSARLLERPQKPYEEIFREQGLIFNHTSDKIEIDGALTANNYSLVGSISSQFISGLLFIFPLQEEDCTLTIIPPVESYSYILLTLDMMKQFGINYELVQKNVIKIFGNQEYKSCEFKIESDCSQMAFYAVLGACYHTINICGMNKNTLQGDNVILSMLKSAGARVLYTSDMVNVAKSNLEGKVYDLGDCPDLGPILCVLGMFSKGETVIANASRLKIKESDRIDSMVQELSKFGLDITGFDDKIVIRSNYDEKTESFNYNLTQELDCHNDHRIAMALTIAAICAEQEATLNGAECVKKSYPKFFEDIKSLGVNLEINE